MKIDTSLVTVCSLVGYNQFLKLFWLKKSYLGRVKVVTSFWIMAWQWLNSTGNGLVKRYHIMWYEWKSNNVLYIFQLFVLVQCIYGTSVIYVWEIINSNAARLISDKSSKMPCFSPIIIYLSVQIKCLLLYKSIVVNFQHIFCQWVFVDVVGGTQVIVKSAKEMCSILSWFCLAQKST